MVRIWLSIILAASLTSCTWYRHNQERAALRSVIDDLSEFQEQHNAKPDVVTGRVKPCEFDFTAPMPGVVPGERAYYRPFDEGGDGKIEYRDWDFDSLEHEYHHFIIWRTPATWRCLDELANFYRDRYKIDRTRRAKLEFQVFRKQQ